MKKENQKYNYYVLVCRSQPGIIKENPNNIFYRNDKDIPININVYDDVKKIKCKVYFGDEIVEGISYRKKINEGVFI